jgi:hypothetical protein
MNILLLASHAVAEYDDVRMFSDLGYDIFAPGGYENPSQSGEGIRPPLPDAPHHPEFVALCQREREVHGEPGRMIDWAKAHIAPEIIDWADAIIVHHFPEQWIVEQWGRIRHKRVIWRTCGQSDPRLEQVMAPLRAEGLQIVRYSPAERRYFERVGSFAGEDALIRFGKYPDDYGPWIGDLPVVGNVTQHMKQRGDACGYAFWEAATKDLPVRPAGPGSEEIGGLGSLDYPAMLDYLRHIRVYLYTGTTPASYTLGLIEAMMSGVPVVSIGAEAWGERFDGADLFEGPEIVGNAWEATASAGRLLQDCLDAPAFAAWGSQVHRQRAVDLFDVAKVGAQWREFLS